MKRLRVALDRLQAQHPRLRARLIRDASGQHYVVPRKERVPPFLASLQGVLTEILLVDCGMNFSLSGF